MNISMITNQATISKRDMVKAYVDNAPEGTDLSYVGSDLDDVFGRFLREEGSAYVFSATSQSPGSHFIQGGLMLLGFGRKLAKKVASDLYNGHAVQVTYASDGSEIYTSTDSINWTSTSEPTNGEVPTPELTTELAESLLSRSSSPIKVHFIDLPLSLISNPEAEKVTIRYPNHDVRDCIITYLGEGVGCYKTLGLQVEGKEYSFSSADVEIITKT